MTAALKNELSSRKAQRLWGLLRQHFVNFERTLEEIIEKRAWEPMGYASFPEAWTAQMSDITLAAEFRPYVVYAYFDQGATVDEVLEGVKGIGRGSAESLKRQKDNGVPATAASLSTPRASRNDVTIVREHERGPKSVPKSLHLALGALRLKRVRRAAENLGLTAEEFGIAAIDNMLHMVE